MSNNSLAAYSFTYIQEIVKKRGILVSDELLDLKWHKLTDSVLSSTNLLLHKVIVSWIISQHTLGQKAGGDPGQVAEHCIAK